MLARRADLLRYRVWQARRRCSVGARPIRMSAFVLQKTANRNYKERLKLISRSPERRDATIHPARAEIAKSPPTLGNRGQN
jgi:hypothetical protein